jgi:uncharacterized protein (UPF0332 family)
VTGGEDDLLARSGTELDAAKLLAEAGFAAQAVSRAYYAAFYAAEAALLELGETRSKHSGVIAAFMQHVVAEGADPVAAKLLRSLFDRRGQADYSAAPVPAAQAGRAIADAATVVNAVRQWLADRHQ